jgi:hypothetical protein
MTYQQVRASTNSLAFNMVTVRRPTTQLTTSAFCLTNPRSHIQPRTSDLFEQQVSRFVCFDAPALVGLAGSLGSPGLGVFSASMTFTCWAFALGLSGISHFANGIRSRRRKSLWTGPMYISLSLLGIQFGAGLSAAKWDNIWLAAFLVWGFWSVRDRRLPHRRY